MHVCVCVCTLPCVLANADSSVTVKSYVTIKTLAMSVILKTPSYFFTVTPLCSGSDEHNCTHDLSVLPFSEWHANGAAQAAVCPDWLPSPGHRASGELPCGSLPSGLAVWTLRSSIVLRGCPIWCEPLLQGYVLARAMYFTL